jgi:hypothetical protein
MAAALNLQILSSVEDARKLYLQLVLVVGPARSGKTSALRVLGERQGWPLVNVNRSLSERLLELTVRQRAQRVARILGEIAGERMGDVLLLDNTEMLFHPELRQDPLRLLQALARSRTVVATWRGHLEGNVLNYATPEHPEHLRVNDPQALLVIAGQGSSDAPTNVTAPAEEKRA